MPATTWASALVLACACAPGTVTASPAPSPDGHELIDAQAGLRWSRCVEGMSWDGHTCVGTAKRVSHAEALSLAAARSRSEGIRWRVPTFLEHKHLVMPLIHAGAQAANATLPGTPAGCHWTASTSIDSSSVNPYAYSNVQKGLTEGSVNRMSFLHAWCIDINTGDGREAFRRERLPVRLVTRARP